MIKIYNTISRNKEEFIVSDKNNIKMYVCGPTVYDVSHIGHARSAFIFNFIKRYLEYRAFNVCFVRNVTDIDDKIINKAVQELNQENKQITSLSLKNKTKEVAEKYLDIYHKEMVLLGIDNPTFEPKAIENIPKMIDFIKQLIDLGYAYVVNGNVYFSVKKFSNYGKLSNQNLEQMKNNVRIEKNNEKQYALDFVLWKQVKENEPYWDSPWGKGRPGWHIECSVMSVSILGEQFDIHGGGLDLIFPHHENEIAQTEALTGKRFANYWMHNGLVTINGEKMSKSLNNYLTFENFLKKYKDPDLLKIIFLNSHYRSSMDYNEEKVIIAKKTKEKIKKFFDKIAIINKENNFNKKNKDNQCFETDQITNDLKNDFINAMNDDFNTPEALAVIFKAIKTGNDLMNNEENIIEKICVLNSIEHCIRQFLNIFVISLDKEEKKEVNKDYINNLITQRQEFRKNKNFIEADNIRNQLLKIGIIIEDTKKGTVWSKK